MCPPSKLSQFGSKEMPGRHAWLWCLRTLALAEPAPHAPAALADDETLRLFATAPAAAWELGPTAQVRWTCGAGQRNADASECLAAVLVATRGAANGRIKLMDSADGVPPGCSYSRVSGAAMFNAGAGQVGSNKGNYQLVCCALGEAVRRSPYPTWDPAPLARGWWDGQNTSREYADCDSSGMHYYSLKGEYGQTNNALIEVVKALRYITTQVEQPAALVLENSAHISALLPYDYDAAFKSWACVLMTVPAGVDAGELVAKQVYWDHSETEVEDNFISTVLHQVVLRPLPQLRERVEAFERDQLDGPGRYNSVHLRWLEGKGIGWLNHGTPRKGVGNLGCQDVPEATAEDVCSMSNSYLDAALRLAPGLPLFLAHDGQQPHRSDALVNERSAKTVPAEASDGQSLEMDMLLLIRSSYFVGNPASSLSLNVARVRAFRFGGGPASNLEVNCLSVNRENEQEREQEQEHRYAAETRNTKERTPFAS